MKSLNPLRLYTHTHTHTHTHTLPFSEIIINKNRIQKNKGRTMPKLRNGIGLSLVAFKNKKLYEIELIKMAARDGPMLIKKYNYLGGEK